MDPLHEGRLERLFEEAMALPPAQRASFLTARCANDRTLRVQLEALLAQAAQAHDFMDRVAGRAVAQVARAVVGDSDDGPEDAADTLAGDQITHFRIVEKLGDGGMGRVYKAMDLTLDRTVALKFLPSHLSGDEEAKGRLVREAKAASALDLRLKGAASAALPRRATPNVEAYDLYLRGRFAWNQRTPRALAQAGQYFAEAAVKDSTFALAYVGQADVYSQLPQYSHREWRTVKQPAWMAARKPVALDSTLAEAHATLGLLGSFDYDWQNAERELRKALALNPGYATAHHWLGIVLRSQGRLVEALDALERARQLDPVSRVIRSAQAGTVYLSHDYDGAITRLRTVLDLDPDFAEAHRLLARSFAQKTAFDSALVHLDRAAEIARTVEGGDMGFTLGRAGRRAEAERVLADLLTRATREYIRPGHVALVHIGLGNRDSAFVWLARAVDKADPTVTNLKTDPRFDSLRGDARFALLLRQMRLQG
jgi:tetratricopeptide (TPR) repeat protein